MVLKVFLYQESEGDTVLTEGSVRVMRLGGGCILSESHNHLHYFESIELKVVLTAPEHRVVKIPPVGKLITTRDEPNEGGVTCEL